MLFTPPGCDRAAEKIITAKRQDETQMKKNTGIGEKSPCPVFFEKKTYFF
jgi:hypothetical protein